MSWFSTSSHSAASMSDKCCVCVAHVPFSLLCSETTDADKFDMVLELIADVGRVMFKLFQHPSLAIVKAAGLIMKSIIEVC